MSKGKNDIQHELPKGWKGELVKNVSKQIQYGYTGKALNNGQYYYLRITDIQNNAVDWSNTPFVEITEVEIKKYLLNQGDIVFTRTGATAGKSYLFKDDKKSVFASYLIRVVADTQKITPEFLYTYFQSPEYWGQIFGKTIGAAQPNFNGQKLGEIKIPLPPLPEQQRIVARLDALFERIDKAIALIRSNLEHSGYLLPAALGEVFGEIAKKSNFFRFDEYLKLSRGHNPPKSDFVYEPMEGYIRFIQIRDGSSDLHAVYVPITTKLKLVSKEDLLLVAYRQVGKVFRGIEGAFNVALCKISNKDEAKIDTNYVYYIIQSDYIKGELLKHSERALIPSMSVDHLAGLQIPIPDIFTQKRVVKYLETISSQQQQLQAHYTKQLQHLQALKASLLDAAFRGEL